MKRNIQDIVNRIKKSKGKTYVLIGAGMSKSAGIPLASEIVEDLKKSHSNEYERAEKKTIHTLWLNCL